MLELSTHLKQQKLLPKIFHSLHHKTMEQHSPKTSGYKNKLIISQGNSYLLEKHKNKFTDHICQIAGIDTYTFLKYEWDSVA